MTCSSVAAEAAAAAQSWPAAGGHGEQQRQAQPGLFGLLLFAAAVPAAAACGLTPELATSYCKLLDGLPAQDRAAKVGLCRWTQLPEALS